MAALFERCRAFFFKNTQIVPEQDPEFREKLRRHNALLRQCRPLTDSLLEGTEGFKDHLLKFSYYAHFIILGEMFDSGHEITDEQRILFLQMVNGYRDSAENFIFTHLMHRISKFDLEAMTLVDDHRTEMLLAYSDPQRTENLDGEVLDALYTEHTKSLLTSLFFLELRKKREMVKQEIQFYKMFISCTGSLKNDFGEMLQLDL